MKTSNALKKLFIAAAALSTLSAPADPVITFDDLNAPSTTTAPITPGYHGFAWPGLNVLDGTDFSFQPSGYSAGVVSPKNVVYTVNGDIYSSQSGTMSAGMFDLMSAYLTGGLNDGLNVQANGYIHGTLAYTSNYVINAGAPSLLTFNFYGVDEVDFVTSGGSPNPAYGFGFDEGFVMDNVTAHVYVPYNLPVKNGGFETGDFGSWYLFGDTSACSVTTNAAYVHSGTNGAQLGPSASPGELSQSVYAGTTANYQLSFWVENNAATGNNFDVWWEGAPLVLATNVAVLPWVNPQYTVTTFKPRNTLQFGFQNAPGYFGLDDIAVTPIPVVYNGGFETNFSGWTFVGNTNFIFTDNSSDYVRSGSNGVAMGPIGAPSSLQQTLNTFAGQEYLVSFWVANPNYTNAPNNEFQVTWNGQTLLDITNMPAQTPWTNYHFTVLATNAQTVLNFTVRNDPAYFALDEVSVIPVPLVNNGGFETGDFTGWNLSGNSSSACFVSTNSNYISSGFYAAEMGPIGSPAFLSQSIPTVPGQTYLLSCWFANPSGSTPNDFSMSWGGKSLLNLTNWNFTNWLNPQFFVTATGTNTALQFGFVDTPSYLALDEVTLQPFPAPVFTSQYLSGGMINFTFNTVPGYQYQIQYSTDLLTWNNLGSPQYASSNSLSGSDPIGPDPKRFYRVELLEPVFIF